jgi:hypothetical protein
MKVESGKRTIKERHKHRLWDYPHIHIQLYKHAGNRTILTPEQ